MPEVSTDSSEKDKTIQIFHKYHLLPLLDGLIKKYPMVAR